MALTTVHAQATSGATAVVASEFINEHAPYRSSHASTIAETGAGDLVTIRTRCLAPMAGRQIALTLGMTSPQKVTEALLAEESFSEELARIRAEVSQRLKRFCSDLSDEQFGALVHAICRCEFTEGLDWPEKEARRKFFDRQYPSVDSGWLPTP